jgi:hypothetical protein
MFQALADAPEITEAVIDDNYLFHV